jgi:hypothetical protein
VRERRGTGWSPSGGRFDNAKRRSRLSDSEILHPIGSLEVCWCGKTSHHDWPGKEQGAPHPRTEEEK